jgi:group I intron endonuclease
MKTGIYQIQNLKNGKCYIGSAASIRGFDFRWRCHRNSLIGQYHPNIKLQRAWNKYGADAFVFKVLLYCDPINCLMYEQIALDHYKPEYNICKQAGNRLGIRHTMKAKAKMSIAKSGKPLSSEHRKVLSDIKRGIPPNNSHLTIEQIKCIKAAIVLGKKQSVIANEFSITQQSVSAIKHNKYWSNI